MTAIEEEAAFEPADYIIDRYNRLLLYNKGRLQPFWLNRADVTFLRQFQEPKSVAFETGERWTIYSQASESNGRSLEVMVAASESAPWAMNEGSLPADIAKQLREEASGIVRQLKRPPVRSRADAWQIVDSGTGAVLDSGGDFPTPYPGSLDKLRSVRVQFQNGKLWLSRAVQTDRLAVVSSAPVGDPYALGMLGLATIILGTLGSYPQVRKFVRPGILTPASLEDVLRDGESETVEFKQEIKDRHSLLKAVTAFANTKGGTVFIGIVDGSREIVGIDVKSAERKDAFERGLRDSIRNSIQPAPIVQIDYPSKDGRTVARILVAEGKEPHSFEGRYYVREGSQSRYMTDGEIDRL
jgi:hypothetical protein